jgi:hypothetical protein
MLSLLCVACSSESFSGSPQGSQNSSTGSSPSLIASPIVVSKSLTILTDGQLPPYANAGNPSCPLNDCNLQEVYSFDFPIVASSMDQYITFIAKGIWDVSAVGNFGMSAAAITVFYSINGGSQVDCGQDGYTNASGPYTDVTAATDTCIVYVPANQTASFHVVFDGRNGMKFNPSPATFTDPSLVSAPVIEIFYQ